MVFYFSPPLRYTPVNIVLTILSHFFVCVCVCVGARTQFYLNGSTEYKFSLWTPLFEKCAVFFPYTP